jgi:hypothetical protein
MLKCDIITQLSISSYMLKLKHNKVTKLVMYPIEIRQDSCSPWVHTQEGVVYHVDNTLSIAQGFYV